MINLMGTFVRCHHLPVYLSPSVATALSWHFAILVNKLGKILKIFAQLDHI